jgi:predicted transporter
MVVVIILLWAWVANQLMNNFEEDLEQLSSGRKVLLYTILFVFAPIFFIEELLEIIIDEIID